MMKNKTIEHCGEKYKLIEKIAEFRMECGVIHRIYLSNKRYDGDPFCLMFVKDSKLREGWHLNKITDAYTLWMYWTECQRQAWILKRNDSKLWEEARKVIDKYQKKKKNSDVLPPLHW